MPAPERTISVVLTEDLLRTLRQTAELNTITVSAVVRLALRAFFVTRNVTLASPAATPASPGEGTKQVA